MVLAPAAQARAVLAARSQELRLTSPTRAAIIVYCMRHDVADDVPDPASAGNGLPSARLQRSDGARPARYTCDEARPPARDGAGTRQPTYGRRRASGGCALSSVSSNFRASRRSVCNHSALRKSLALALQHSWLKVRPTGILPITVAAIARSRAGLLGLVALFGALGLACQTPPTTGPCRTFRSRHRARVHRSPGSPVRRGLHPLAGGPLDAPPGGADGAALFGPGAALAASLRQPAAACRLGAGVGVVHRLPALPHHAARRVGAAQPG